MLMLLTVRLSNRGCQGNRGSLRCCTTASYTSRLSTPACATSNSGPTAAGSLQPFTITRIIRQDCDDHYLIFAFILLDIITFISRPLLHYGVYWWVIFASFLDVMLAFALATLRARFTAERANSRLPRAAHITLRRPLRYSPLAA